ncbi:MAG: hypothetical protein H6Q14_412 [Bacteroidetes bacterium]|nr:hypothetical protein [Bacteroidota bacterium]
MCFTLSIAAFANAQNLDKLFNAFQGNTNVEHQTITKEMMGMMAGKADSTSQKNISNFIQRIEKMDVFTLEDYQGKKPDAIIKEIENYKDGNGFETLICVNEDKDHVRIVAHKEGNVVSEVAIIVRDEKDIVLVRFVGNLTLEDLQSIVNEQKGKFQKQ